MITAAAPPIRTQFGIDPTDCCCKNPPTSKLDMFELDELEDEPDGAGFPDDPAGCVTAFITSCVIGGTTGLFDGAGLVVVEVLGPAFA